MYADWLRDHLPAWLADVGPFGVEHWQWLGLVACVLLAWVLGRLGGRATSFVARRLVMRTEASWDDEIVRRLGAPLTAAWAIVLLRGARAALDLPVRVDALFAGGLRAALLVALFWAVARSVDLVAAGIGKTAWAAAHPASPTLLPLGARVLKVLVFAMGAITIVADLGYPVGSLLAGLGVGGVALALASKTTLENLFGAFSIGVDQPFRVGDTIRVEGLVGTVETLGLRSTRLRTPDRSLVSIPNSKLAELQSESLSARDRLRLAGDLGLQYGTTAAQVRVVLEGLRRVLGEHPRLAPDPPVVRFKALGESALVIEVAAWFATSDFNEFMAIREEVLLAFMDVVEKAGAAFALPSRLVYSRPTA